MKEFRNPFVMIGKVIKYEMLYLYRILIPVFGAALVLALFLGLSINHKIDERKAQNKANSSIKIINNKSNVNVQLLGNQITDLDDEGFSIRINGDDVETGAPSFIAAFFIGAGLLIVTIVIIKNRFSKGMLEEEAYVNFTLPVTVGEHLWGRYIAYFICGLACLLTMVLVTLLCGLAFFRPSNAEIIQRITVGKFTVKSVITILTTYVCMWSIISTLIFLMKSFDLFVKKHRGIIKFGLFILILVISSSIMECFEHVEGGLILVFFSVFFSALYFTGSYLLFKLRLNLE